MATRTWQDVDGNWNNTANWSGATVPAADDTIIIDAGSKDITTNIDQSAVLTGGTLTTLNIGPNFTGSIGTPASQLKMGTNMAINVDCPNAKTINLFPSACANFKVLRCPPGAYGLFLYDGTISTLCAVRSGGTFRIGANANIQGTLLICPSRPSPDAASVYIESGAEVRYIKQFGGRVWNYADLAANSAYTIDVVNGEFFHLGSEGSSTGSITGPLTVYGGRCVIEAPGETIATLNVWGGTADFTTNGKARTVTNCNVYGGRLAANPHAAVVTFTNPVSVYGGKVVGNLSQSQILPAGGDDVLYG